MQYCNRSITIDLLKFLHDYCNRDINFREWLVSIKDLATRLRLARRLEKAQRGNLGDIKQLANFLYEMREFFGAGWRMYYFHQDPLIIVMLNGGGKKSQAKDIKLAKALIMELGEINEIIKKD